MNKGIIANKVIGNTVIIKSSQLHISNANFRYFWLRDHEQRNNNCRQGYRETMYNVIYSFISLGSCLTIQIIIFIIANEQKCLKKLAIIYILHYMLFNQFVDRS